MVEVLKTGLYDTIQDLGRFGVQEYGVPFSGVMDLVSAKVANTILGNPVTNAVLEITIFGPQLKFHCATEIALSGADLNPKLNATPIKMNTRIQINENDVLSFGQRNYGCRSYLAVKSGFQTEFVMNSFSMYQQITSKSRLKTGDRLSIFKNNESSVNAYATLKIDKTHFQVDEIEVFKGLEYDYLSEVQQELLFKTEFTVSKDSNRMAYQVKEVIANNMESIITSLVLPGTVQLTPFGKLMFLMRDSQTTGGYPRVLQVREHSISQLSQKIFGEKFRLKCID
ncbi:biotin-dependent carboxyltransferase family protein [Psychroserpens mesophilus]|uniref:5-oxoprolinase subunit C family protein n=1 Tax=Psychroserpens mesophilus TaxID=325473 RepID=UPI003D6580AA